jgi:NTE family protein
MRHQSVYLAALVAGLTFSMQCLLPTLQFSASAADPVVLADEVTNTNAALVTSSPNRDASVLAPPVTTSVDSVRNFADRQKQPRVVLVLSGGGCKTAAQIGVIKSLEAHHVPIDSVIGTSMGSMIGALYCAGMPLDQIENLFIEKSLQKSLLSKVIVNYLLRPVKPIAYMVAGKPYAGLSSGEGYLKFLRKNLPEKFSELKTPFAAVVTNITDGQTTVLADGDLPQAVLASSAVPTLIKPVLIKGKLYVDGGLRANLPTNIAQSLSSGLIISVLVDSAIKPEPNKKFKSRNNLVMRVADIVMAASDKQQAKSTDILIYPDVDFCPGFTKDSAILKRTVEAGERAAEAILPKIDQALAMREEDRASQVVEAVKVVPNSSSAGGDMTRSEEKKQ